MSLHPAEAPNPSPPRDDDAEDALERAIGLAATSIGELMHFWGFKPSMGKIWAVLYLSREPQDAEQISRRTAWVG